MSPFIENIITVVGPHADLEAINIELSNDYACDAIELAGNRLSCREFTLGTPAHDMLTDMLTELSRRYPRVTIGNLWWTEDAEEHGCCVYVVGTTEFEWWGQGMEIVDEDDYPSWEDAVEAEANLQHGPMLDMFLSLAETINSGAG